MTEFPQAGSASFVPDPSRPEPCLLCDDVDAMEPWRRVGPWPLLRCPACGLVSLLGASRAGEDISETNDAVFSSEGYNDWLRSAEPHLRRRYRGDLAEIEALAPGRRLLDVGCGPGLFLDEARAGGFDVRGIEASEPTARLARERFGLEVVTGSLERSGLGPESFDIVTFFDVLEHLPDPRPALRTAHALLRPGGLLVAQSPNRRSLMAWATGERWHWYLLPQHLHHFTPSTMERLVRAAGFEPLRVTTADEPGEFLNNLKDCWPALEGRSAPRRWTRRGLGTALRLGSRLWAPAGLGGLVRAFARRGA